MVDLLTATGAVVGSTLLGGAGSLWEYNQGIWQFDKAQRQNQVHQLQNMRCTQAGMFREDIRDLFGLTIAKMDSYLTVNTLQLGFAINLFYDNELFKVAPTWIFALYALSVGASVLFFVLSMWYSVYASIAAQSCTVRCLTQALRVPIPRVEEYAHARAYATDYESEVATAFRLPFLQKHRAGRRKPLLQVFTDMVFGGGKDQDGESQNGSSKATNSTQQHVKTGDGTSNGKNGKNSTMTSRFKNLLSPKSTRSTSKPPAEGDRFVLQSQLSIPQLCASDAGFARAVEVDKEILGQEESEDDDDRDSDADLLEDSPVSSPNDQNRRPDHLTKDEDGGPAKIAVSERPFQQQGMVNNKATRFETTEGHDNSSDINHQKMKTKSLQLRRSNTTKRIQNRNNSNFHFHYFDEFQDRWRGFDTLARILMGMGTYHLLQSTVYYALGWVVFYKNEYLGGLIYMVLLTTVQYLLTKLELYLRKWEEVKMFLLIVVPPALSFLIVILAHNDNAANSTNSNRDSKEISDAEKYLTPLVFLAHLMYYKELLWLSPAFGSPSTNNFRATQFTEFLTSSASTLVKEKQTTLDLFDKSEEMLLHEIVEEDPDEMTASKQGGRSKSPLTMGGLGSRGHSGSSEVLGDGTIAGGNTSGIGSSSRNFVDQQAVGLHGENSRAKGVTFQEESSGTKGPAGRAASATASSGRSSVTARSSTELFPGQEELELRLASLLQLFNSEYVTAQLDEIRLSVVEQVTDSFAKAQQLLNTVERLRESRKKNKAVVATLFTTTAGIFGNKNNTSKAKKLKIEKNRAYVELFYYSDRGIPLPYYVNPVLQQTTWDKPLDYKPPNLFTLQRAGNFFAKAVRNGMEKEEVILSTTTHVRDQDHAGDPHDDGINSAEAGPHHSEAEEGGTGAGGSAEYRNNNTAGGTTNVAGTSTTTREDLLDDVNTTERNVVLAADAVNIQITTAQEEHRTTSSTVKNQGEKTLTKAKSRSIVRFGSSVFDGTNHYLHDDMYDGASADAYLYSNTSQAAFTIEGRHTMSDSFDYNAEGEDNGPHDHDARAAKIMSPNKLIKHHLTEIEDTIRTVTQEDDPEMNDSILKGKPNNTSTTGGSRSVQQNRRKLAQQPSYIVRTSSGAKVSHTPPLPRTATATSLPNAVPETFGRYLPKVVTTQQNKFDQDLPTRIFRIGTGSVFFLSFVCFVWSILVLFDFLKVGGSGKPTLIHNGTTHQRDMSSASRVIRRRVRRLEGEDVDWGMESGDVDVAEEIASRTTTAAGSNSNYERGHFSDSGRSGNKLRFKIEHLAAQFCDHRRSMLSATETSGGSETMQVEHQQFQQANEKHPPTSKKRTSEQLVVVPPRQTQMCTAKQIRKYTRHLQEEAEVVEDGFLDLQEIQRYLETRKESLSHDHLFEESATDAGSREKIDLRRELQDIILLAAKHKEVQEPADNSSSEMNLGRPLTADEKERSRH
ncbi:unnamed protein product [Amoebophrya sp. A120]|nr:unnamed protein product [Amoebophrya sp. A120]|eukprot:GSA120T00019619001.1